MFNWQPILEFLDGKRVPWDGVFGYIDGAKTVWIEVHDEKIYAFPDHQTRHAIGLKEAKELYQKRKMQPTLFEMYKQE